MTRRHLIMLACRLTAVILFSRPMQANPGAGIVVDAHGQVFFTDTGAGIWKIDTGGKLTLVSKHIYKWIAIDQNGKFAAMRTSSWHRIDTAGNVPVLIGSNDRPIAVSADGNLYHAACHYSGPLLIVREVPSRDSFVLADVPADGYTTRMCPVDGVAVGRDGSVYFTELQTVNKVESTGSHTVLARIMEVPDCTPVAGIVEGWRPYLRGLDVAADGSVYVAASGCGQLLKVMPDGKVTAALKSAAPWSPTAVAVAGSDLYVLEYAQGKTDKLSVPRVRKISSDGSVTDLATVKRN